MADSYLIQIVAKLRDEASSKIANLKREIDDLKAHAAAQDLSGGVSDLADEVSRAADEHRGLTQAHKQSAAEIKQTSRLMEEGAQQTGGNADEVQRLRQEHELLAPAAAKSAAEIEQAGRTHAETTGNVDEHTEVHRELARQVKEATDAAEDEGKAFERLQKQAAEAEDNFTSLAESFREGSGDLRSLRLEVNAAGSELDSFARRMDRFGEEGRTAASELRLLSDEAKSMSRSLKTLEAESSQHPIASSLGTDKARQDLQSLTQDFERFQRRSSLLSDDLMRSRSRMYASEFGSIARRLPNESVEETTALTGQLAARKLATPVPVQKEVRDAMADTIAKGDALISRSRALDQAAQSRTATNKELETGYRQVASGLQSVWKEMEVGSTEARRFGAALDEAAKKSKNIDLARSSTDFGQFVQEFAHGVDQIGIKVISLSAALRGIRLVALVGFLQPLITGLVSLAAGFFSVASGAAQAAATIGGVFVSGLGQLVPMASIAIAALIRLRDVFQAVSAAQAARQEAFFQPNQGLITQLQNTNQLIETEQNLKNAYYGLQDAQVQVRQSQIQLTQARIDAIRNLQDLVIAEQSAKLALSQSNLAVVQAQQALQKAQASGSQQAIEQAQLQLRSAQISQETARFGVPRAEQNLALARSYGVAGSPTVLAATEAARQARLAVAQQEQAIALA